MINQVNTDIQASFREILSILFLRKWIILGIFLSIVSVAYFLVFYFLSPSYKATASIMINHSSLTNPLADAPPATDFAILMDFHTQKSIIVSKTIADPVVQKLELTEISQPMRQSQLQLSFAKMKADIGQKLQIEAWTQQRKFNPQIPTVDGLLGHLEATSKKDTRAIDISYTASNPDQAKKILSMIIDVYIQYYHQAIREKAYNIKSFLEIEVDNAQQTLENAEQALLDFRKADTVILNHGKMGKDAGFVGITDSISVQDEFKIYLLQMEEELRRLTSKYSVSNVKVIALQKKIQSFMRVLNKMPEKAFKLSRLKHEIEIKQQILTQLQKNMNKARIVQSQMLNKMGLITIINKVNVNQTAIAPKKGLILIIAIFGGFIISIFVAFIRHYFDHALYTPQDIERLLNLKTLASIKKV